MVPTSRTLFQDVHRIRRWIAGAVLVGAATLLMGCGSTGGSPSAAANSSVSGTGSATGFPGAQASDGIRLGYSAAPSTLDPQKSNINFDWRSWSLSYECLLRTTPAGSLLPSLATSYAVSPDHLNYTFTLRPGVKFQDGSAFTSASVVYSFHRLLGSGIPYAKNLFSTLSTVTALGADKVRFSLSKPATSFLLNMGNPYAVGCAIMSPNASATHMDGTGPWQQVSYTPKQALQLKRFADYWGTKAAAAALTVYFIPEPSAMVAALDAGRLDIAYPDPSVLPALQNGKTFAVRQIASPTVYDLCLNNGGAMADVRVRQAVLLSIDAAQFGKEMGLGFTNPSGTIPEQYSWAPRVPELAYSHGYNIAKAKQLLAAAGYPHGLSLTFIYPTNLDVSYDRGAQVLQGQLAQAGIKLNLAPLDEATWVGRIVAHKYDMFATPQPWFADPGQYIMPRNNEHSNAQPPQNVQSLWNSALAAPTVAVYYQRLAKVAVAEDQSAFNYIGLDAQTAAVVYRSALKNVQPDFTQDWLYLSSVSR